MSRQPVAVLATAGLADGSNVSTAELSESLRDHSDRVGGYVVLVAAPDGPERTDIFHALSGAGLTAVPLQHPTMLLEQVAQLRPDLVVLDVAVCATIVQEVLAELRIVSAPAVILTGALAEASIRATLLCAGADDCLLSPYLLDELLARVLAVLRRHKIIPRDEERLLVAGSIRVNLDGHTVEIDDQPIALTMIEFRLLAYLMRHRGVALPRQRLLADVWGYTVGTLPTVTVHVRRLRTKIEADPSRPAWVETVYGVGYRFAADPILSAGNGDQAPSLRERAQPLYG